MTQTAAALPRTANSAPVEGERTRLWSIGFGLGFVTAAFLLATATFFALSGADGAAEGPANPILFGLLGASLALMIGLGALVMARIGRIARARATLETGARLHLRFMALFSLAAVTPAVVVAFFYGASISRGLEDWFSDRVKTVIESAAVIGRVYLDDMQGEIGDSVQAMATDMNGAVGGFSSQPDAYRSYLTAQAERRFFQAAYVIDGQGVVLARAQLSSPARYVKPEAQDFADARAEVSMRLSKEEGFVRALYRLTAYGDAFLYVTAKLDPVMLGRLSQYESAVVAYRGAQSRRARLQTLFVLSYLATALLVLLGAVWLGLSNATRISEPIGRLAEAARRVAAGDLAARVGVGEERDEVDALGRAFNRMTTQLEAQRGDLVKAREEAEARSAFIRTVLGDVSAGVIGLDPDGRIVVANRSAANLLSESEGKLEGRRLAEVAPEFAEILRRAQEHPGQESHRVDLLRRGGTTHLSVRINADAVGRGSVLTFDDMTRLVAAQRQEAWKDVARRIAHEIKNPLTPIQLSAERLKRKYSHEITNDRDVFERCTDTILRQVADIGRMVDEFSGFARMPSPRPKLTDLGELLRASAFAQRLSCPDIRFDLEIVAIAPFWCDERLMAQAIANVVKNASEAIQSRRQAVGEPKEGLVQLRLSDVEDVVVLEVVDNGIGFPPEDRARLVEPYVTTRTKGTGLGLAIVQRVVEDHGGILELSDADPAPGAVVRFILPRHPAAATPDAANMAATPQSTQTSPESA
jgi:two-component system, NtrC family, nitrogen regulation sensor histidine kinase NtrY